MKRGLTPIHPPKNRKPEYACTVSGFESIS
jgi:hypothetical protein